LQRPVMVGVKEIKTPLSVGLATNPATVAPTRTSAHPRTAAAPGAGAGNTHAAQRSAKGSTGGASFLLCFVVRFDAVAAPVLAAVAAALAAAVATAKADGRIESVYRPPCRSRLSISALDRDGEIEKRQCMGAYVCVYGVSTAPRRAY
jgi:hypothetical protein